ncbi:MAG: N-acetyltransferase [Burkholderiales bacterium]|nr:N-acetyltransferase [Burkholderiales bacterium]
MALRKYYFVSQPIPAQPLLPPSRGSSIEVNLIDESHPLVSGLPRPLGVVARRFASGSLCFLATKEAHFVGFLWLHLASYSEDEVRCVFTPLPAGLTVWDYDVHVEPEYRNSFAFARLWDTANQFLREKGVKWSASRISAFNAGSINSHVRLGAFPVASAYFFSGRHRQLLLSGTHPYVHYSADEEKIPEIKLLADRGQKKNYSRFSV